MDFSPRFRLQPSSTRLNLQPSPSAGAERSAPAGVQTARRVKREAMECVEAGGGDPSNTNLVLSRMKLQFGKYKGMSFLWLLGNDLGYAVLVCADHQLERDRGNLSMVPLMENKDALDQYMQLFPWVKAEVRSVLEGRKLVGFGTHAAVSFAALYESVDPEHASYVQWLRRQVSPPGSQMSVLIDYIKRRDEENTSSSSSSVSPPPSSLLQPALPQTAGPSGARPVPRPPAPVTVTQTEDTETDDETLSLADMELDWDAPTPSPPPAVLAAPHAAPVAFENLLPEGWKRSLPVEQHEWVSKACFRMAGTLKEDLQVWWYPPGPKHSLLEPATSLAQFLWRPFVLWMPYRMWSYQLSCPVCRHRLTGAGLYRNVRKVLDRDGWYYMGTEYMECRPCGRKWPSWAPVIIQQLDQDHIAKFPAILTYRLSCDKRVMAQMAGRTLGNGVSQLRSYLIESHTTAWMEANMSYLSTRQRINRAAGGTVGPAQPLPPMTPVPSLQWLSSVYVHVAAERLEENKAKVTSVFGKVLKMDFTKKMTKKLAGKAAGTAACVINVGNEHGQVLMSVLSAAEGSGLLPLARGLVQRYRDAGVPPPQAIYVDRNCCGAFGQSTMSALFSDWEELTVRLDVGHFMRRFAAGVTSVSHLLYGPFMRRISFSIFEWDREDVERLREAKLPAGTAPTKKEMARHCRRSTRGAVETERLLEETIQAYMDVTDTMGIPLLDRAKMEDIWSRQRRHVNCIQDIPGISLYTLTGHQFKGGVELPVYRCARGSTSLESFHRHLNRFIPGSSASAMHFQVYLLEGITRWNEDRGRAAVQGTDGSKLCYKGQMQSAFQQLTQEAYGVTLVENYTKPWRYTGELIGVEYLYSQTGMPLQEDLWGDPDVPDQMDDMDYEEDEDFGDSDSDETVFCDPDVRPAAAPAAAPAPAASLAPASVTPLAPIADEELDD